MHPTTGHQLATAQITHHRANRGHNPWAAIQARRGAQPNPRPPAPRRRNEVLASRALARLSRVRPGRSRTSARPTINLNYKGALMRAFGAVMVIFLTVVMLGGCGSPCPPSQMGCPTPGNDFSRTWDYITFHARMT